MRPRLLTLVLCVGMLAIHTINAAEPTTRYGIKPDLKTYPQGSAKETLASAIKAIDNKKIDYLLAQLAEPEWVDGKVKVYGGKLSALVDEAQGQLDALAVKRLKRFEKEGKWKTESDAATVSHDKIFDRVVRLKKIGERWFLLNDNTPE